MYARFDEIPAMTLRKHSVMDGLCGNSKPTTNTVCWLLKSARQLLKILHKIGSLATGTGVLWDTQKVNFFTVSELCVFFKMLSDMYLDRKKIDCGPDTNTLRPILVHGAVQYF